MSAPTNAELSTKINELTDLIRNLATARVRTPSPAPAQPQVQPSSGVQVTPLSANVIAGASLPDFHIPQWVASDTVSSVVAHGFRAADLFKLDHRARDSGRNRRALGITSDNKMELIEPSVEYRSLSSILVPLQVYFNILLRSISVSSTSASDALRIASAFNAYSMQLSVWSVDYEFPALLEYHQAFFDSRLNDMSLGIYLTWGKIDIDLHSQCLAGHTRRHTQASPSSSASTSSSRRSQARPSSGSSAAGQICFGFNQNSCNTSPCPANRKHVCTQCHRAGLGDQAHPAWHCPKSGSKAA
ncbi:hypothetical protein PENSPDRAFT_647863 [Peniophora sp. CONT]|nr:hypothetical protein PENSPDRAFT_647863 [Peniophora sp. CONT]